MKKDPPCRAPNCKWPSYWYGSEFLGWHMILSGIPLATQKRGVLPAKRLASKRHRPTTAGLAPMSKSSAEKAVDAVVEEARARIAAEQEEVEKRKASAGGAIEQVAHPSPVVDPDLDPSAEDLEAAIYACLAQADLAMQAMDVQTAAGQPAVARETEERKTAEATTAESDPGQVAVDAPTAPSGTAETTAGGAKRALSGAQAPPSKRRWPPPVVLGTRDG